MTTHGDRCGWAGVREERRARNYVDVICLLPPRSTDHDLTGLDCMVDGNKFLTCRVVTLLRLQKVQLYSPRLGSPELAHDKRSTCKRGTARPSATAQFKIVSSDSPRSAPSPPSRAHSWPVGGRLCERCVVGCLRPCRSDARQSTDARATRHQAPSASTISHGARRRGTCPSAHMVSSSSHLTDHEVQTANRPRRVRGESPQGAGIEAPSRCD